MHILLARSVKVLIYENRPSKMKLFSVKKFFLGNFDFKNGCNNEFEDNNKK